MKSSFTSIMDMYSNNIERCAIDMQFSKDSDELRESYQELSHFLECARKHTHRYGNDEAYTIACDIVAFCYDVDPYCCDMEQEVLYNMDGITDEVKSGGVDWFKDIIEECEEDAKLYDAGVALMDRIKKLQGKV